MRTIALNKLAQHYKEAMTEAGPWGMYMYMQGETIPKETNHVTLSKDKKDRMGNSFIGNQC